MIKDEIVDHLTKIRDEELLERGIKRRKEKAEKLKEEDERKKKDKEEKEKQEKRTASAPGEPTTVASIEQVLFLLSKLMSQGVDWHVHRYEANCQAISPLSCF